MKFKSIQSLTLDSATNLHFKINDQVFSNLFRNLNQLVIRSPVGTTGNIYYISNLSFFYSHILVSSQRLDEMTNLKSLDIGNYRSPKNDQ